MPMAVLLRISEAASLALHTVVLLAAEPGRVVSTGEIASTLRVSAAHLAKAGLVRSIRGPKGGFILGRAGEEITLLEVYEAVEGPLVLSDCLFSEPICSGERCILGGLLEEVNDRVRGYLAETRISELDNVYHKSRGLRQRRERRSKRGGVTRQGKDSIRGSLLEGWADPRRVSRPRHLAPR